MNKIIKKTTDIQDKIKRYFFEDKVKEREKIFERKYQRKMDDDEIKSYKFKLFTIYTLIIIIPLLFLISLR